MELMEPVLVDLGPFFLFWGLKLSSSCLLTKKSAYDFLHSSIMEYSAFFNWFSILSTFFLCPIVYYTFFLWFSYANLIRDWLNSLIFCSASTYWSFIILAFSFFSSMSTYLSLLMISSSYRCFILSCFPSSSFFSLRRDLEYSLSFFIFYLRRYVWFFKYCNSFILRSSIYM